MSNTTEHILSSEDHGAVPFDAPPEFWAAWTDESVEAMEDEEKIGGDDNEL